MGELSEQLAEAFHSTGRRLTSQRRLILEVLEESDAHLDADEIYRLAKMREPDISLATVYRTLAVLRDMGLVEEHRLGEEHSHYEAVHGQPHYHFICLGCERVIEFEAPFVDQIVARVSEEKNVQVTGVHLRLSGYCEDCKQNGGQ